MGFTVSKDYRCIIPSTGNEIARQRLCYVNGIMTSLQSGKAQVDKISKSHGDVQVTLCYNPTRGLSRDLIISLLAKCGIKMAFDKMCAQYFSEKLNNDSELELTVYAHSQGGTRINNIGTLLGDQLPQRMAVDTFGSATIIEKGKFKSVRNYVSKIDLVPCTSGWNYLKNVVGFDSNIIFLTPNSYNPLTEHYFLGETYLKQIQNIGKDFVQERLQN